MNKILNILAVGALFGAIFGVNSALAAATVTPASGGLNLAQGSGFVTLTNVIISESASGDIAVGNHTIILPSGWEFDTSSNISISTTSGVMTISPTSFTPGVSSFTFQIQSPSVGAADLAIKSMRVRPTGSSNGNITHSGASIAGVTGGTNFASLSVTGGSGGSGGSGGGSSSGGGGASGGGAPIVAPHDLSIKIDGGVDTTTDREVDLRLLAEYAGDMILANDEPVFTFSLLEPYNEFKTWTLSEGDGEKTVFVKFRSPTGVYSEPISATIILDSGVVISDNAENTGDNSVSNGVGGVSSLYADVNSDGNVDIADVITIIPDFGTGSSSSDITEDGNVNISDFNAVVSNWSSAKKSNVKVSTSKDSTFSLTPTAVAVEEGALISVNVAVNPGSSTVFTGRLVLDYPSELLTFNNVSFSNGWIPLAIGSDNIKSNSVVIRTAGFPGGIDNAITFATITFIGKGIGDGVVSVNKGSVLMNERGHDIFNELSAQSVVRVIASTGISSAVTVDSTTGDTEVDSDTEASGDNKSLVANIGEFFNGIPSYIYLILLVVLGGGAYGARAWFASKEEDDSDEIKFY